MSIENPYITRDSQNHIEDGEPRALYWRPYRLIYEGLKSEIKPGTPVRSDLPIMLIGKECLTPFHFDIKNKDRKNLCDFSIPGISGHISFTDNLHIACGALFDRDCRTQDHLYVVPRVNLFEDINYSVFSLPTPNQPLHVRIVHVHHLENPNIPSPPISDRKKLAELFGSYKIC